MSPTKISVVVVQSCGGSSSQKQEVLERGLHMMMSSNIPKQQSLNSKNSSPVDDAQNSAYKYFEDFIDKDGNIN